MGRGKSTRKKNMNHKLNKRKSKKVQDGGFAYETWKNTIDDATNIDDLNKFKSEMPNDIDNNDKDKISELTVLIDDKINQLNQSTTDPATVDKPETPVEQVKENANKEEVKYSNQTDLQVEKTVLNDKPGAQLVMPSDRSTSASDVMLGPTVDELINLIPLDKQQIGQIQNKIKEVQPLKNEYKDRKLTADEVAELKKIGETYKPVDSPDNKIPGNNNADNNNGPVVASAATTIASSNNENPSGKICVEGSTSAHQLIKVPVKLVDDVKELLAKSCDIRELVYDANGNLIK